MNMTRKTIGSFECVSGKFAVSDPCYDTDVWCRGELENIKRGKWSAEAGMVDDGKWGLRVALLSAQHESYDEDAEGDLAEYAAEFEVGVDSGQAGIFDAKHYRDDAVFGDSKPKFKAGDTGPGDVWYDHCCDKTIGGSRAGVIPYGAVSSSGYGDGGYGCVYYTDAEGLVVKVAVQFIG